MTAVVGEVELDEQGLAHDKTSDMATVLMQGRDGRMALLAFTGTEPNPSYQPKDETSREEHEKLVVLDVASGAVQTFDLTAETVALDAHQPTP